MKTRIRLLGLLLSLVAGQALAQAQATTHSVYVDLDANAATGCSIDTAAGAITGVELRLEATVDGAPPQVQSVGRALCDGAVFGQVTAQPAGYAVGLDVGIDGADVVEFSTPLAGLGDGGAATAYFVSSNAGGADITQAAIVLPGVVEPPAQVAPAIIPATGWLALLLLVGISVWLVRRHPSLGTSLVVVVLLGSGVAWAANFVSDGQIVDWNGETPAVLDPANDPSNGAADIDIVAAWTATEAARLFVRVDIRDLGTASDTNTAPTLADASFTIDENSAAGTLVGNVIGDDTDGDTLAYAITAGNTANTFAIDATSGAITVANAAALDFDTTPSFSLTVTATDDGTPPLSDSATVTITLVDINEAPQIADQSFAVTTDTANGATVGAVIANDPDSTPPNATLSYAIAAGNTGNAFAIDAATGVITVADATQVTLVNDPFVLTVQVGDGGTPSLQDSATVTIDVTDNNAAPVFAPDNYSVAVDENSAVGTGVVTVTATDPDSGDTLAYAITAGNTGNTFAIDAATGAITVANAALLDVETTPTFSLTVSASDDGTPSLSDTASVNIAVNDINEMPTAADASFSVANGSAAGTTVGSVSATDPDGSAPNATLAYAIIAGNTGSAFAIDAATGSVTVADSAQINSGNSPFVLSVQVSDGGTPSLQDTASLTITVTGDDPNVAPAFSQASYSFGVDELVAAGTPVGTTPATDADNTQTLTYAITAGNTGNTFGINPANGAISVANAALLDFEAGTPFALTVSVTDNGTPALSDTASVAIAINDVNEAPQIEDRSFLISDTIANGATVGTASATDPDTAAPNATLTWAITAGNTGNAFAIGAGGVITVVNNTALTAANAPFLLTVQVSDGGMPSLQDSATITVDVTDENDAPTFQQPSYAFSPNENSPLGAAVGSVSATDPNAGQTITYSITGGNTGGAFAVNTATGAISVANTAPLNFEATPSFTLTLQAADNGTPQLSATTTVTITLVDINEAPTANDANFTVLGNAAAGAVVGSVTATDPDTTAPSNTLTWAIASGNTGNAFAINPGTGQITVATPAALAGVPGFALQVTVTDGGSLADTAAVTMNVTAVNNAPSFTSGGNRAALEDAGPQSSPWATNISDNDGGTQTLTFLVTSNNAALFSTQPAVSPAGLLTYTNAPNANGTATVTVLLVDDGGTANGGIDASAPQTFTITATAVNDAPSYVDGGNVTRNEDAGPTTLSAWATAISPGPADESGQALTFSLTVANPALFASQPAVSPTGTLTFTPAADASGVATVSIVLSDNGGTANGGVDAGNPSSFTITIVPIDDAPMAVSDSVTVEQDSSATTIDVLANDTDIDGGPIGITGVTQPANGTVTFTADDVTYTPDTGYSNDPPTVPADTFTYTLDGGSSATVDVTVTPTSNETNVGNYTLNGTCGVLGLQGPGFLLTAGDAPLPVGTTITTIASGVANSGVWSVSGGTATVAVLSGTARQITLTSALPANATMAMRTTLSISVAFTLNGVSTLPPGYAPGPQAKPAGSVSSTLILCSGN